MAGVELRFHAYTEADQRTLDMFHAKYRFSDLLASGVTPDDLVQVSNQLNEKPLRANASSFPFVAVHSEECQGRGLHDTRAAQIPRHD